MTHARKPVVSMSLEGDAVAPHIDPADIEHYIALAAAGVVAARPAHCGAVQNNMSLRHDTRTTLTRKPEGQPD